jgi:hypothetical protein
VNARSEAVDDTRTEEAPFDFEATFHAQYERIARLIARVVQDPARAAAFESCASVEVRKLDQSA